MTNEEAKTLLDKYNKGLASPSEVALLQYWFIHTASQNETDVNEHELQRIVVDMRKKVTTKTRPGNKRLWPRLRGVAVAVVAIGFGIWFYTANMLVNHHADIVNQNDVAPGKNTATLTLANGKIINLSDAKSGVIIAASSMRYNDGSTVDRSDHELGQDDGVVKQLVVSTPRGGNYQVVLPDGTKVWLNAESRLEFPSNFKNAKQRVVKLFGEGYFEVTKGTEPKRMPFIVESRGQSVEVLGTHFNINSYADEPHTKTTLLEGSIKVTGKSQNADPVSAEAMILKPGQQVVLYKNFAIQMQKVQDLEDIIAWRALGTGNPGSLVFSNNPIETVMRGIGRWYDVTIEYRIDLKKDLRFSGVIRKDVNLSRVLEMLEHSGSAHFKIEGRRIIIMK